MGILRLAVLGPPLVEHQGEALVLPTRKTLALLIYLALSPNRVRTRDHLRGLLWPENDEERARRSLNEAIRRLRRALGDGRLISDGDSVAIAGEYTGIYPSATPGGWRLLGYTDTVMFDPARTPPALLAPGDRVRFVRA